MRAFKSNDQAGLEALTMVNLPDPGIPGPGEIDDEHRAGRRRRL